MGMTRMGPLTFQQPVQCRECDGEGKFEYKRKKKKLFFLMIYRRNNCT
jgi:DnaJ-class molecular chaperone